jgi:tetratricopeptide (TPR) repeat protein
MKNKYIVFLIIAIISFGSAYASSKTSEFQDLVNKAKEFRYSNTVQAEIYIKRALELANKEGIADQIAEANYHLGIVDCINANYDEAKQRFDASMVFYQESEDKVGIAKLLNAYGQYYRMTHNFVESIKSLMRAIELKIDIGDELALAISYNNLGLTYAELSDNSEALTYCLKAYEIARKHKDTNEIINSGNGLAIVYGNLGEVELSLDFYQKLLNLIPKDNLSKRFGITNNLATDFLDIENYDKANEYYLESLSIATKMKSNDDIALSLLNLGNLNINIENDEIAKEYLYKANETARCSNDAILQANIVNSLGILNANQDNVEQAIILLKQSRVIFSKHQILENLETTDLMLSELYMKNGQFTEAHAYQKSYFKINQVIAKSKQETMINSITTKLKTDKAIDVLMLENELLIARNELSSMIILVSILSMPVLILFGYIVYRIRKQISVSRAINLKNEKYQLRIQKILKKDLNRLVFDLSMEIAKNNDTSSYQSISSVFNKFSRKYNELLDEVKTEDEYNVELKKGQIYA